ncbi:MAG: hypothetical protein AAB263_06635, partial [Planctomycetota bacterium]
TDTNLVKLTITDDTSTEGGVDTAQIRVSANAAFTGSESMNVSTIPAVTTADPATDYALTTALTLVANATAVTSTLSAPRDYLISEGNEAVVLALDQPIYVSPAEPPYFVVGLPGTMTIVDGPAPQSDIAIIRSPFAIANGTVDYQSGVVVFGNATVVTYSITNTGELPLHLGALSLGTATNLSSFSVDTTAVPATIAPGDSYAFTVTATPTAGGYWALPLSWASDDPDEAPMAWVTGGFAAATASSGTAVAEHISGTASNGCGMGNLLGLIMGSLALMGLRRRNR